MVLVIGEILFDVFPGQRRIGGAPFNFAFHLKKLGIPVRFASRIGKDPAGEEILAFLKAHEFDLRDIQRDAAHPTGSVQVSLDEDGIPQFRIEQHAAYDFIQLNPGESRLLNPAPELFYFGTLVQRTRQGHDTFHRFLSRRPAGMKTFYDVNLRPECYTPDVVLESLKATDILKLNLEEFQELAFMLGAPEDEGAVIGTLMETHAVEVIVLTQGAQGARWISRHGQYFREPRHPEKAVDTVGAGDAFAAAAAAGYLKGFSPEKILSLAQQLAASVCAVKGALPENDAVYAPIRKELHG
ncbi:MAG: hypothetical protein JRI76_12005 [Deltaproteobacteria bacterium]|nr:hypothetical protein [Deltaproteobacteria bacterium]